MAAAQSSTEASATECKVALCQMKVVADKAANIAKAKELVVKAAADGAKIIVLPEVFNGPYATSEFASFAEPVPDVLEGGKAVVDVEASPTLAMLSAAAKEAGVYVVGGSVAETCPGAAGSDPQLFNTCTVWAPSGALIAKHRKMHLFDIDIPDRITFKESDSLTAGDSLSSFTTPWGKIGLGICYDLRFPQLSSILRYSHGCDMLIFPGAFNTTTGPAHWELLLRSRAVDNQLFVLACSPARNADASYQAYGHSSVVDPWGEVVATTAHEEDIVTATVDSELVREVRSRIPVAAQRRLDVYDDVAWKGTSEGIVGATRAACAKVPSTLGGFFSLG